LSLVNTVEGIYGVYCLTYLMFLICITGMHLQRAIAPKMHQIAPRKKLPAKTAGK